MKSYIEPIHRDDLFCIYCQKQYKTLLGFKRHIINKHGLYLARRLDLLTDEEEAERTGGRGDPVLDMYVEKRRVKVLEKRGLA